MLEPQTRAALTEQLRPPPGFELAHAVGTTFTLDLASALAVPLSFASHRVAARDDTLGVLDSIRRAADRVDIFAQAGEITMGTRSDLVAFLEPMVHPVAPRRGLFHPKVWFLEYRAREASAFRFLCSSRNLTADRSWDVIVRLDGHPAAPGKLRDAAAINRPLVDLLRSLADRTVHPIPPARRARIDELAARWRGIVWDLPDPMRAVAFHAFGVGAPPELDLHGKRALIISPFLSDEGVGALRTRIRAETHLVSRAESLDRLGSRSFDTRLSAYVLDDAASPPSDESAQGADVPLPRAEPLAGLHAKAVILDRSDGAHVFLGSDNATDAGWNANVEVMVELVGPAPRVGVEATLRALGDLAVPYETTGGKEPDAREEAERALESLVRSLASARFSARLLTDVGYALCVWADETFTAAAARHVDVVITWHLLTRPDLGSATIGYDESTGVVIDDIPLADITPFLVLTATDSGGNQRRTVVLARLLDDVENRRDAVIARQLTDRAAFIRLLTLLLELSGVSVTDGNSADAAGFFGSTARGGTGAGLFEALVRAVGDDHGGLSDARRIIDYLREHDADAVLPDGFDELWSQVWAAHRLLRGEEE